MILGTKYFIKKRRKKMESEINGYYFDGEKSYIIYRDEYGNETMEEWEDEQSD